MIFYRHISMPVHGSVNASPVLSGAAVSASCNATVETGNLLTACPIIAKGGGVFI